MQRGGAYGVEKKRTFSAQTGSRSSFSRNILVVIVVLASLFLAYQIFLHFKTPTTDDILETPKQDSSFVEDKESVDEINFIDGSPRDLQNPFERKITPKTISYQVHSWDDLRLWPQGFQKGVTYFKLDLFFIPTQVLDSYQSNPNICHGKQNCFLLTHNIPVLSVDRKNPQFYYFTQNDFISMLRDLKKEIVPKQKVMIALCFKYYRFNTIYQKRDNRVANLGVRKNPFVITIFYKSRTNVFSYRCFPDVDEEWISLIDDLYSNLVPIQKKWKEEYNVELEFVLDESGTPGGNNNPTGSQYGSRQCLLDRWPTWNFP